MDEIEQIDAWRQHAAPLHGVVSISSERATT